MLRTKYIFGFVITLALTLASCSNEDSVFNGNMYADAIELKEIRTSIGQSAESRTRAGLDNYTHLSDPNKTGDRVGRFDDLEGQDKIVFTNIHRTASAINAFKYYDISYNILSGGGMERIKTEGYTEEKKDEHPEKIYWSDGAMPHTFIGYSCPNAKDPEDNSTIIFDWNKKEKPGATVMNVYYGSIGNPTESGVINFNHTDDATYGNQLIKNEDLLLTHNTDRVSDDAVAFITFHHALALVRVEVNISNFAPSAQSKDTESKVSDMVLKGMPTLYKWEMTSNEAEMVTDADRANITSIHGDGVSYNQIKDTELWTPRPDGEGSGRSRTFTFYGLAVPRTGVANQEISFTVTYPDPMDPNNPEKKKSPTYNAKMTQSIDFVAGYCTTIKISLDHKNEKLTVGAEYQDWEYVETPDDGSLKKNDTFLKKSDIDKVKLSYETGVDADNATWLYNDGTNKVDVYKNTGTKTDPYRIKTAIQFYAFAQEVNHGMTFKDKYIELEAGLYLQESEEVLADATEYIEWPGIGTADHIFQGNFNGGFRHINLLYGRPLFTKIGPEGIIDHIFITDALGINGSGSIAEVNDGIICGSHVEGNIVETNHTDYCGSIVGINNGVLIACSHIGSITGNANILGALLGKNDGILVTCYNVGDAQNTATDKPAYAGVGDFTQRSVAYCCYFNKDFYTAQDYPDLQSKIGHVAFPLTTSEMQSNKYVNQLRVENKDTEGNVTSLSGEITDDSPKNYQSYDPFYYHWSMNAGLKRAVEFLIEALGKTPDNQNFVSFHAPGTSDTDQGVERVTLKKSQVEWLVNHFATTKKVEGNLVVEKFTHQFQFIPGTYPKLK